MNYKPHPGVVLTNICNMPVLIPLRVAYPQLQRLLRLSVFMVPLWLDLCEGRGIDRYVETTSRLMNKDENVVRRRAERFCEKCCELGYLIEVPEEGDAQKNESEQQNNSVNDFPRNG